MSLTRHLMLATALTSAPVLALAQEPYRLDAIVLSAGLLPAEAEAYGRDYSIVTATEIDDSGAVMVQDVLRSQPGLAVSSAGSSLTQIRIRGAEANHTLILIDGIEASGGLGEYYLSGLSSANLDRIEVLRGAQSVFYGSNASSGVINIITDKGAPGLHYGGKVEIGNGSSGSVHVSRRDDRGGLALNLSNIDDHGYDQSGDGGEKDGMTRMAGNLSGDWQLGEDFRLGGTAAWAKERYDYDSTPINYDSLGRPLDPDGNLVTGPEGYIQDTRGLYGKRREFRGGLWAEYDMLEGRLQQRVEYQDSVYEYATDGAPMTRGENEKVKYRLSYGLDGLSVAETRHLLNLLIEEERENSSAAPEYRREKDSIALEYRAALRDGLDLQGGLRRDDSKQFEDFTSWNLGLSWRLPDRPLRFHASAGRGLADPTYDELYGDVWGTVGNPDLKPEENRSFDIGVEMQLMDGRGRVDLTYFHDRMRDEITYLWDPINPTNVNQPGESTREGIEITGEMQLTDALFLGMNYTYLDAKNPDGSVEVRRPKHQLNLTSTMEFLAGRAEATLGIRHVAGNYDDQWWGDFARAELPNYTTVDLAGRYDLTDEVRLTGRVVNLTDAEYSDVWGYASPGRTAYLGLEAAW